MKTRALNLLLLALLFVVASCGQKEKDSTEVAEDQNEAKFEDTNKDDDTDFAVKAADGGMLEVQLGQLAQSNASSAKVKEFAKMMVEDHGRANDELKALAQQKNITLPVSLSDEHQKKYQDLSEKQGAEFDKEYIDFMVKDHKEDIDNFKEQAEDGNDPDLKSWASTKVSSLQHHLEMAEATQDALENAEKTSNK